MCLEFIHEIRKIKLRSYNEKYSEHSISNQKNIAEISNIKQTTNISKGNLYRYFLATLENFLFCDGNETGNGSIRSAKSKM